MASVVLDSFCDPFAVARPSSFVDFSASSFAAATEFVACASCYCPYHHLPSFFADASAFDVDLD